MDRTLAGFTRVGNPASAFGKALRPTGWRGLGGERNGGFQAQMLRKPPFLAGPGERPVTPWLRTLTEANVEVVAQFICGHPDRVDAGAEPGCHGS